MSRNDWESGTLLLPSAEVAPLKKTLREWLNPFHAEVRAEAVRLHKEVIKGTRSARLYGERLRDAKNAAYVARQDRWGNQRTDRASMVHMAALRVLDLILYSAQYRNVGLHQPTVADVEVCAPRATSRTTSFPMVGTDGFTVATVTIEGRNLHWSVPEGNHAVESAREAPLAEILFARLGRIQWTRGTGGHFVGNDEYNRDERDFGGGANYITSTYGPLGQAARIDEYVGNGFSVAEATRIATAR